MVPGHVNDGQAIDYLLVPDPVGEQGIVLVLHVRDGAALPRPEVVDRAPVQLPAELVVPDVGRLVPRLDSVCDGEDLLAHLSDREVLVPHHAVDGGEVRVLLHDLHARPAAPFVAKVDGLEDHLHELDRVTVVPH